VQPQSAVQHIKTYRKRQKDR